MYRLRKISGFTIVELLIVIVVIGILASITIVAFNGVQNRANDAAVQSDLSAIGKQIAIYQIQNGTLPKGGTELQSMQLKVTQSAYGNHYYTGSGSGYYNLVYCWPSAAEPDVFTLVASSKSGNVYQYTSGRVSKASYTFTGGSQPICANSGHAIDSGTDRDWFFDTNTWRTFLAS